jgi:hypothetical protein
MVNPVGAREESGNMAAIEMMSIIKRKKAEDR